MKKKEWQDYSLSLKEVLSLEFSPVAVSCLKGAVLENSGKKVRICKAILDAGRGEILQIDKKNNDCFGASLHLGFNKIKDKRIEERVKKFVVEEEKLFCSYQALDRLISQMEEPPDNSNSYFILAPMEKAQFLPQLVIFAVNAEVACRLLSLVTFLDGVMPNIKIGGPTCGMSIIYPLLTGEVNVSFYDYTSRMSCNIEKDKLLISIPYAKLPRIIESIDKCPAGRLKTESQ